MQGANYNRNRQGFTGHIRDTDTGLTYMQARYYDPVIGRFLSNDPVGFAEGGVDYFNRYAYTANDPVNNIDPDGEFFNFVAKFAVDVALEVAIQVVSGDDIDLGSAVVGAATGLVDPTKTARKVAKLGGALNDARKTRAVRGGCPGKCFAAGTEILTDRGMMPIEQIRVGDLIMARDVETGEEAFKPVTQIFVNDANAVWELTIETTAGESEVHRVTENHPYYVE